MSVSILVVDDEPDVAELFRQRFRREKRDGSYVMHFANSGEGALEQLTEGIEPTLIVILATSTCRAPSVAGRRPGCTRSFTQKTRRGTEKTCRDGKT